MQNCVEVERQTISHFEGTTTSCVAVLFASAMQSMAVECPSHKEAA